jgi:hypothetical protein
MSNCSICGNYTWDPFSIIDYHQGVQVRDLIAIYLHFEVNSNFFFENFFYVGKFCSQQSSFRALPALNASQRLAIATR